MNASTTTKSDFIRFLQCPRYAWLWKHRPDLRGEFGEGGRFAAQGREVEGWARKLFPRGREVKGRDSEGYLETQRLMDKGAKVLYQATALTPMLYAKSDILVRDGKQWRLYEVKSSATIKEDYLADIYFQSLAFESAGIPLASIHLVLINGNYVFKKSQGIQPGQLFTVHDLTSELHGMELRWKGLIEVAQKVLASAKPPKVLVLNRSLKHELSPEMLAEYWKGVPEFSVYRIAHITREQLLDLLGRGILDMRDVPEGYFTSERQSRQVRITQRKEIFVDHAKLKEELRKLKYPLYFLDYETLMPAIPMFDGHRPHQTIPFQYSLHVVDAPGAEPRHFDYLHTRRTDPSSSLLCSLKKHIGGTGSVLAWNAPFEKSCNQGMALRNPQYAEFLNGVNARLYDLALIFKDTYVDYRFKGSLSIKNVLPVMAPELSYTALKVRNGEMAIQSITELIGRTLFGRSKIIRQLKDYCSLDTLAMVRIFEALRKRAR
jgi:Domain of unknown function(DUF2779)